MNYRNIFFTSLLSLTLLCLMGLLAHDASAQARGWCEQKSLAHASTLNTRVTMPSVIADGDNVYIVYRQGSIKLIKSNDRGKTWSDPIKIDTTMNVTNTPAIGVYNGKIIVVWPALVDVEGFSAFQLFSAQSIDGGATFSAPKRITHTQEDTFSPQFMMNGDSAQLLWLETPLAQTLGSISTVHRPDFTPETVAEVINMKIKDGSLEDRMSRVRSTVFVRSFNFASEVFSPPSKVDVLRGQALPHIFTIYGPISGTLHITANQNTEIRSYSSTDGGQKWKKDFQNQAFFDSRKMMDIEVVDGKINAAWISRTFGKLIAVNFVSSDDLAKNVSLSPDQYVRYAPRITYSDGVFHIAWEAGEEENSWITYIRTDTVSPSSKITSPDDPELKQRSSTFFWEGSDNISDTNRLVFAYSSDSGKTWSAPQAETSATIDTPKDGDYVFMVRAEDVAGNIQEKPAEFKFNTFKSAPETRITQAPPASMVVNKRSVEIKFTGDDNTDDIKSLDYSSQTDDGPWSEFSKGVSHTFASLSNGQHVLKLRMRDSRGNIDPTPAQCMVTVQVGLELILETKPPLTSNSATSVLTWKATDDKGQPVNLSYLYRLNRGDVQELGDTQKLELQDLKEGQQRIEIWGRDSSGDETQKENYQWLIDRTAPETTATFTKEYTGRYPLLSLGLNDPALADGSTTAPPSKLKYQIGDGAWIDLEDVSSSWSVPKPLSFYSWGYIVKISAIDVAGNTDASPSEVDLRIHVRTNPYIFYSVVAVFVILILFLLRLLLKFFTNRAPRRSLSSSSSSSSLNFEDEKSDDSFGSSFSMDDDDDDDKKDNDPYS